MTDFGISKLMDMNLRMTPLTQVLPTPYMPFSPVYSSKLDCFSYGVLALQILTRNIPPGDASGCLEDPRFSTEILLIYYTETERHKRDIDLVEASRPTLSAQ